MRKIQFKIEYPLNNASVAILWNNIGTAYGLSEWFADSVDSNLDVFQFRWSDHAQTATLLYSKQFDCVRFQWEEDKATEAFFEIRIITSDMSKDIILQITDYAEHAEVDDTILLWNQQIDKLKRATGIG